MHWAQDELTRLGYCIEAQTLGGVDFLATRQSEKYAVRAQLSGSPKLTDLLELEGARRYYDCAHALLVHTAPLSSEASEGASRLQIQLEQLSLSAEHLWPWLAKQGAQFPEPLLRQLLERLYAGQSLTREALNELAGERSSNALIALLTQLPQVEFGGYPASLQLRRHNQTCQISLQDLGYQGFQTFQRLSEDVSEIPLQAGVYVVEWGGGEPDFLTRGSGGHSKGDPNVPVSLLRAQWISEASILYVGKAGASGSKATLRSRVKQMLEFGQGKPAKHYGGRYLWQLRQAASLRLAWKCGDPTLLEQELLSQFTAYYGRLPFANLQE
ncbi:hypothetical protein JST97_21670 [bacterium]|nr:hypothetical protein [bacterium]